MKYYKLLNETDSEIIGDVNGIQSYFADNYHEEKQLLVNKFLYNRILIDKINSFELDENVVVTDVMTHGTLSQDGIIVSDKFKNIVEKFSLLDVQFVDITFNNRKELSGFYFMFFNSNVTNKIDYKTTKFGVERISFLGENQITPIDEKENNLEGLQKLTKTYSGSARYRLKVIGKYSFTEDINYDVFRLGGFDKAFYFSESVVNILTDHRLSGFYFSKSNAF